MNKKLLLVAGVLAILGSNAMAANTNQILGDLNKIQDLNNTTIVGNKNEVSGEDNVVMGNSNKVAGRSAIAIGNNIHSEAQGYNSGSTSLWSKGRGSITIGDHTQTTLEANTVIGHLAKSWGKASVAIGAYSIAYDDVHKVDEKYAGVKPNQGVFSIGSSYPAIYDKGTTPPDEFKVFTRQLQNVGAGAISATSTDAINGSQLNAVINALKFTTVAEGTNTTVTETKNIDGGKEFAVHVNKDLVNMNSVQFKNGVVINNNGINVGGKTITNVAAGQNDTDAVNVSQLNNAKDQLSGRINSLDQKVTTNAADIRTINYTLGDHEGRITILESNVQALDNKINTTANNVLNQSKSYTDNQAAKVGANAAALSALHPLDFNADEKWQFSVGFGNYKGKNATALGAFYQPNENVLLSVGTTLGTGENMINAGATVRFGSHSSMTTNKQVAVAKEVQDLKLQLSAISQKYDNLVKNLSAQKAGQDVDFEYSDLPKDHWAYDFVKKLSDKGYLNGYPDGTFKGDAKMTRYEFAAALWRAVNNGAIIDSQMAKAIKEFEPELEEVNKIMRYRIDTVAGKDNSVHKTERLRVNKNDDPFTHMKRDDYGTKTYTNK